MNDLEMLQERVRVWHVRRFPDAINVELALKLAEETGEVASAVLATSGNSVATGKGDVGGEAADVMIVLLGLLSRFYPEVDLETEVKKKLSILEDPNGGHRASGVAP